MKFTIPVREGHIRTFKDPVHENVRTVHALVNVNDLPKDLPIDPDPRRPKPNSKVTKVITSSLATNNGLFHLLNRGITLCVASYNYSNKSEMLAFDVPEDEEKYGIIDGGHTHFAVTEAVEAERERLAKGTAEIAWEDGRVFDDQFVHLEIIEGVEDNLAEIAEARNFSVQLSNWTLANYRNEFDWLLDALGRRDADEIIDFGDNKGRPVGILDIIQVLGATNPSKYPVDRTAKDAYTSAGKILDDFIDKNDPADFRSMADVARSILELYDYVRINFGKAYNRSGGRFRATSRSKLMGQKRKAKSLTKHWWTGDRDSKTGELIPITSKDPIDKGLAIPLISGFRALLEKQDGQYTWLTEPKSFFDKYGDKLVKPIMDASDQETREAWFVGRNPSIYTQLTSEVRRWYLEDREASRSIAATAD